ncbi:hypothetical protein [Aerosakkonema funiforme]|uniref:hypothetical protein n=1 Tax=Aerosakkonema funiforme TaxID=1246630 RepID=UPI0035B80145
MNILEQGDNDPIYVDYRDLLQKILQCLRGQNSFRLSENGQRLSIDIDTVASQVAALQVQNPLSSPHGVRSATIHFTQEFQAIFGNLIREIRDCLQEQLESSLGQNSSIEEFVASLVTPLTSFQGNSSRLGFTYNFNRPSADLLKQKLCVDRNRPGSASLLKFHKLTITVREIDRFPEYLQDGLSNHIDDRVSFDSQSDREELFDRIQGQIEDDRSDFNRLKRIVDTETLGKLKKEAKIRYLEYIRDNIDNNNSLGFIYLQDLIRRLRLIEDFLNQDRADSYYDVNYAGAPINYKDLFARSEVLDSLPIIPIVTGNLGESTNTNEGERQFIFGLKMKFGNPVEARGGDEVFDYNLNLIDPESPEHNQERERNPNNFGAKVLKLAFLYFFVFACNNPNLDDYNPNDDLNYNPIIAFERILSDFQGNNEEIKNRRLSAIVRGFNEYNIREKINRLRELLKDFLDRQTILPRRTYPIQISVRRGILENDTNQIFNGIFFREVVGRNPKECLRYISIDEMHVERNALCQLPASITIEDIRYFSTEERQQFSMQYDITGVNALPVMWVPHSCIEAYQRNFMEDHKLILFRYNNRRLDDENGLNPNQAFVYRFTISLLAYICLKILLDATKKRLFIPMVRLHEGTHNNRAPSEKFMAHLSKVLSHLLNEQHRCNSQGFRVRNADTHRVRNGLNSLYSVLPKKFRFTDNSHTPTLDKLAIIVVSSLESDARTGNRNRENRISNLVGEAIGVTRQKDGAIRLYIIKTFSENYKNKSLYRNPAIIRDTVKNLYDLEYRHFLYVAQAPFTSNLNITQSENDDRLYFMSPALIEDLKGNRDDIKIYPVFFDKYYVRRSGKPKATSFYIQNTTELLNVAQDSAQQAVVFFNLFNGISVGQEDDRFYNGVISYSTLLNIYPGVLDDRDIRSGLINDDSPLKNDILQYLTLFHFSRFEKTSDISLKLDPYENIIGEESFSKLSVFQHMRGEVNFNSLAFLTEVRGVLNG